MLQNKKHIKILFLMAIILSNGTYAFAQLPEKFPVGSIKIDKNMTDFIPTEKNVKVENDEVRFVDDELEQNRETNIITATGNVEIDYKNMNVSADKIIFNQNTKDVKAIGNVVFMEPSGSVVFSDSFDITGDMKDASLENVRIILADKSRLAAKKAVRINANKKVLTNAIYTACDSCKGENPLWVIKSEKVEHDEVSQDVRYKNAVLELGDVPIFYTPYLSHPDPKVKRRSGFLTPKFGGNSKLGMTIQPKYYWSINPYKDFTFAPIFTTKENIVYTGEYRQNFMNSEIFARGSITQDSDDEIKGHLFLNSRYEINDYWNSELQIETASTDKYLDKYDFEKENEAWLNSSLKFEGFDKRNYMDIEVHNYQIISDSFKGEEEPIAIPYFDYHNIGETQKYGAYTETNLNAYALTRDYNGNNQRFSARTSWNLPYTSEAGSSYKLSAQLQSDLYNASDYIDNNNEHYDTTNARFNPSLALEWKHPLVKTSDTHTSIIEPVVMAVASPSRNNINGRTPNEDSRDINLDDTNLLELNRYSGFDRVETGSRVNYGVNVSAYGNEEGKVSFFLGQSYRLDTDDESYGTEADLENNLSDYIGRVYASPNDNFDLVYRFRFDKDDYNPKYQELSTAIGPPILRAYINYVYLQEDAEKIRDDFGERKELYLTLKSALTKNWNTKVYSRFDLSDDPNKDETVLEYGAELAYEDECFEFVSDISKDYSYDNYDSGGGFAITFTLTFKTLGVISSGS